VAYFYLQTNQELYLYQILITPYCSWQDRNHVLLGGGAKYFGKSNGNLDKKFKKDGYDLATNSKELSKSDKDKEDRNHLF
jgi:alkaline phosphatase